MNSLHLCVHTFLASIAAYFGFHCCFLFFLQSVCVCVLCVFSFLDVNNLDYQIFPFSTRPTTTTTTMNTDRDRDRDGEREQERGDNNGNGNDGFVLYYFYVYVCMTLGTAL